MLEVLAAIGVAALVFLTFIFLRNLSNHRAFERVYINGKPYSLNRLFVETAKEIDIPNAVIAQISPIIFAASIELRQKIQTEGLPYKAIIALFLVGSFQALAQQARMADNMNKAFELQILAKKSVDYASSFAPKAEGAKSLSPSAKSVIKQLSEDSEHIGLEAEEINHLLKMVSKVKKEINNPEEASFWFLANTIIPELTHGHNHIYRGILSMHGQHLHDCLGRLISLGVKRKIVSQEEAENMSANVRQEISEVG